MRLHAVRLVSKGILVRVVSQVTQSDAKRRCPMRHDTTRCDDDDDGRE